MYVNWVPVNVIVHTAHIIVLQHTTTSTEQHRYQQRTNCYTQWPWVQIFEVLAITRIRAQRLKDLVR